MIHQTEQIMETTSIILAGSGVIQSLLLLLLIPSEENMNENVKKEYDGFMKLKGDSSYTQRTKELMQFIADDQFEEDIYKESRNWSYLPILKNLKETFVGFYFRKLEDLNSSNIDLERVADIDNKIGQYIIQLMRLRKVIQPEVQISKNVHPRTKIKYLAIKAYWIDEGGRKVRKFTKSIGRAESYPGGIEDKQALIDGIGLIQPVLFETYKEIYPK